ncbi:hypothetical protein RAD16_23035 [Bradyrhizobium sp. 18BD]
MTVDTAPHESLSRPARLRVRPTLYFILGATLSLIFFYTCNKTGILTGLRRELIAPLAIFIFSPVLVIVWSFAPARFGSRYYRWLYTAICLHLLLASAMALLPFLSRKALAIDPGLVLSVASFYAASADILILLAIPVSWARPETKRGAIYGVRYAAVAALIASFVTIPAAIVRAEQIAAGRAYCIVLPDERGLGYHAPSMFELSSWKMRAYAKWFGGADDFTQQFHALMIVRDDDRYAVKNWSYMAFNFRDDTTAQFPPVGGRLVEGLFPSCQMKTHFALHIPISQ